jgi:hypothetical protein
MNTAAIGKSPGVATRAVRRMGELLKTFNAQGQRTDKPLVGASEKLSQREAAESLPREGTSKIPDEVSVAESVGAVCSVRYTCRGEFGSGRLG